MKFMFNRFCPSVHQYIKDVTHCFLIALILIRNLPPYLFLTFCICQFFMFALRIFSLSLVLIQYRVSGCSFLHVFCTWRLLTFLLLTFLNIFVFSLFKGFQIYIRSFEVISQLSNALFSFFSLCILFCFVYIIVFL